MSEFNKNNPTNGWTDDEKYDFCKVENKWTKELPRNSYRNNGRVCDSKDDPTFGSVEEMNKWLLQDIEKIKQSFTYLCDQCDFGTNWPALLKRHQPVHGFGYAPVRPSFLYFDPEILLRPKLYFDMYFSTSKKSGFTKGST